MYVHVHRWQYNIIRFIKACVSLLQFDSTVNQEENVDIPDESWGEYPELLFYNQSVMAGRIRMKRATTRHLSEIRL